MKRPSDTKKPKDRFHAFAKEFMLTVNDGIHDDLSRSEDYIERNELPTYIDGDGLDITAVERNEELSVRDVLEIGIHWARRGIHENWHSSLDDAAKNHGFDPDLTKHKDKAPVIHGIENLPDDVKVALMEALEGLDTLLNKKKGKK